MKIRLHALKTFALKIGDCQGGIISTGDVGSMESPFSESYFCSPHCVALKVFSHSHMSKENNMLI